MSLSSSSMGIERSNRCSAFSNSSLCSSLRDVPPLIKYNMADIWSFIKTPLDESLMCKVGSMFLTILETDAQAFSALSSLSLLLSGLIVIYYLFIIY